MTRTPVESSLLASHGWEPNPEDPTVGTLEVEFKAKGKTPASVYRYAGVRAEHYEAFKNAESAGKHFLANIKGKFQHTKVEPDATPKES